jgi:hypothetical protein
MHAYAILDVKEIEDVLLGVQLKVNEFYGTTGGGGEDLKGNSSTSDQLTG